MQEFGKLDFNTSFVPTSGFPVDGRTVFETLEAAKAAASTAGEVGNKESKYHYGMKLMVDDGVTVKWYTIQRDNTLQEEGTGGSGTGNVSSDSVDTIVAIDLEDYNNLQSPRPPKTLYLIRG